LKPQPDWLSPPPPGPTTDFTDLWWGGDNQSGWGFNIIQHATNQVFGVMYTYDSTHRPLWFVLPGGSWTDTNVFEGSWYRVTGPAYNGPFDSKKVDVVQVGTVRLTFTDSSHGTLQFTVNGVTVSHDITRQPF
jgi:hypothetical protein